MAVHGKTLTNGTADFNGDLWVCAVSRQIVDKGTAMRPLRKFLFGLLLLLAMPCYAMGQALPPVTFEVQPPGREFITGVEVDDSQRETLPLPLRALSRPSSDDLNAAASQDKVERLPAVAPIEVLQLPDVAPNAIRPFAFQERQALLVRGNEVTTISNSALHESGLLGAALSNSPTLARSYQLLHSYAMEVQQLDMQLQRYHAMEQSAREPQNNPQLTPQEKNDLESRKAEQIRARKNVEAARLNAINRLVDSERQFEQDLWSVGLNGAKVGLVTSMDRPTGESHDSFVLVKSLGNSPSNNMGYSTTKVYRNGELGATTVPSEYLLPFATSPNDNFYDKSSTYDTQRAPDGIMIPLANDDTKNPILQILAMPQGYVYYDTGFVDTTGGLFAENISLEGTHDSRAGQSFVTNGKPVGENFAAIDLAANAQVMDIGGGNSLQFFVDANNYLDANQLGVYALGARIYNRSVGSLFEGWSVYAGQKQSLFGDTAVLPVGLTVDRALVGTVNQFTNTSQLGWAAPINDFVTWNFAIEDPQHGQPDVAYVPSAMGITKLNRWPTFATNVVFSDPSNSNRLQLGALIRSNGYEVDATKQEFLKTGWGLSAISGFRTNNSMNFIGVAGGSGVGNYIQGIQYSVAADPMAGFIDALSAVGAYVGRQTWYYDEHNNPKAVCNIAYGYSLMENPNIAGLNPNRKLQQAWINYMRFFGDRFGIGVEYQYGSRQAASDDIGEDHRFMLVFSARTDPTKKSTQVQNAIATTAVTGKGGLDEDLGPPTAADVIPPAGATLNGRSLENVVNQFQRGGSAFQQGL